MAEHGPGVPEDSHYHTALVDAAHKQVYDEAHKNDPPPAIKPYNQAASDKKFGVRRGKDGKAYDPYLVGPDGKKKSSY